MRVRLFLPLPPLLLVLIPSLVPREVSTLAFELFQQVLKLRLPLFSLAYFGLIFPNTAKCSLVCAIAPPHDAAAEWWCFTSLRCSQSGFRSSVWAHRRRGWHGVMEEVSVLMFRNVECLPSEEEDRGRARCKAVSLRQRRYYTTVKGDRHFEKI